MQLKLKLEGNKIELPIASAHTVQGFIYNALSEDQLYLQMLHGDENAAEKRKFKLFTFGELTGRYEVIEKRIIYPEAVHLEVRSADAYMIQLLYTYFLQNKNLTLGKNPVEVTELSLHNKNIFSDSIRVKTKSPITVYLTEKDGHTVYYTPHEAEFYSAIIANARHKWCSYSSDATAFDFSIEPVENARFVKRATKFKETLITAWHGEFQLKGNPQVLDFLYHTGLGSKNSQGFGMFEIVEADATV